MDTPLRKARHATARTLADLAHLVGVTPASLSRIERGTQKASTETAAALSHYLGNITEMEILYPERYVGTKGTGTRKGRATA